MAEVKLPKQRYRVDLVEYERGWGSKIDDKKYFDSEESAKQYCRDYNSVNNSPTVFLTGI